MLPVVLHKGLFGFGDFQLGPLKMSYFNGIDHAIAARGHPLIRPQCSPTGAIALRARQLKQTILKQMEIWGQPRGKVVIIAHSMGGLDSRYMISKLAMADHVAALVTITTPHRGSPYADWSIRHVGQLFGALKLMKMLKIETDAFHDLTTDSCRVFNQEVIDAPGVKYYSVSAAQPVSKIPAFAMHSYNIIFDAEGDNDGLVSIKSGIWGTHLGTWPADHWQTINKRATLELKMAEGQVTGYYMDILDRLQRDGVLS